MHALIWLSKLSHTASGAFTSGEITATRKQLHYNAHSMPLHNCKKMTVSLTLDDVSQAFLLLP